jgi:hypothetical protein
MSPNDEKTFVRAKPTKIVIEELYQYKADVQENLALSFEKDKSRGTIKVEFVYDGERLSPGWERAVLLRGLRSKWKLPGQIRNRIGKRIEAWREKHFVGPAVRGACWLFGWVWRIGWWLPGYLIRRYFKLNLKDRSFGVLALADVEKCGAGLTEALVGYLALRDYNKPTFDEDWPEHLTLPLEIRIDDLESKISSNEKHVIEHRYSLEEPKKRPVRLGSISLCDEVPSDKRSDLDLQLMDDARVGSADIGELLWLEIPLIVDIDPPDLDEQNQLNPDVAKDLWEKGRKSKESQEKQANAQEDEERGKEDPPFTDQLAFFPKEELDDSAFPKEGWNNSVIDKKLSQRISEELSRLSRQRGGYLFFAIDSEDEEALKKLRKEVVNLALKCNPPVPIMKPYTLGKRDEQQLAVVPVPRRMSHSSGYRRGPIQIVGGFTYDEANVTENRTSTRNEIEISWWELAPESEYSLARDLVALANTDGGHVTVEIGPTGDLDEAFAKVIRQAYDCHPPMTTRFIHIFPSQSVRGRTLKVIVPSKLPYVFTHKGTAWAFHKGTAWAFKGGRVGEMEADDIYELFEERGELHYPTLVDPPVVTYACIEWPHMDYRKRQGIRHDPENRVLEWVDIDKEKLPQTSHDAFETALTVKIMHPIELYQRGYVKGQIRVQFDKQIWSGLDVEYFDATGQRRPYGSECRPKIEKSTTAVIDLDITLNAIFERRPFYPHRRLEFEGVKPDPDRLADIKSLLAELGLEDIYAQPFFHFSYPVTFEEATSIGGIVITGNNHKRNLKVQLKVEGSPKTISRQRKNGKRIDRMQIPTGQLQITLAGESKGESPLELSMLLNQIQHLLKERFSFVHMRLK